MSKPQRLVAISTILTAVGGVVGNQITFNKLGVPSVQNVIAVLIFFGVVAACTIVAVLSEPGGAPPEPPSPPGPWSARDMQISLTLMAITVLGAIALVVWPFVVSHQLKQGPAVTVSVSDEKSELANASGKNGEVEATVRVEGRVRRLPETGYSYWLFQRLHYVGTSVSSDEFYPKAKLVSTGKYHVDLMYGSRSAKEDERAVYVVRIPNDRSAELAELIRTAKAYQEDPCEKCRVSEIVQVIL